MRRAVIVGGGIGGLAAALEIRRVGFDVTVLERREQIAEVETGFLLWSFAIGRLRSLGLGSRLDAVGRPVERLTTKSWRGKTLSDLSLAALGERAGAPSYDINRAGLQRLLADALGEPSIQLGARCVRVVEEESGVSAVLDDGRHVTGDLLIGADGVNSTVRREIAGEIALRRDGVGILRGISEPPAELVPDGVHIRVLGAGALFGVGRLGRQARWYAGAWGASEDEIAARFEGWCEPVEEVIEATDDATIIFNDVPRAAPLRRWTRSRIALLGDAAHPTLPTLATGGGMAIEDAGVLGECLARTTAIPDALPSYERRRRAPAARVQRATAIFGHALALRSAGAVQARDLAFRFAVPQRWMLAWLMRGPS